MGLLDKVHQFKTARQLMDAGLYNYFRPIESAQENTVRYNGREVIMLGSNNYLGLTNHPKVKEAAKAALEKYGSGCAGSRFLNGTLDVHVALEEKLADLVGKEKALVFSTGFFANLGTISTMVGRNETVIVDRTDHASIIDGCRMSYGNVRKYKHQDMAHLAYCLEQEPDTDKLIVVDGVFSMEGDIAKLPEIAALGRKHKTLVMVDDAHGIGVMGAQGRGTCNHFGVTDDVHLIVGTFSKSLASVGGFVASDAETIHYIQHLARVMIFSASPPPASVASVAAAVDVMLEEQWRHSALWRNTRIMRERLQSAGFDTGPSETPIIPVVVGEDTTAYKMCVRCWEEGVFVNPIVSPAVDPGHALLRLSLMATHTEDEIHKAMDVLTGVGKKLGVV
ncbi:MAG TPA: aminotransferase class I/II-fold pyridoxal phosphate-dependent enzyme [Candidatus Krumholzibacteria bacterium]|nr:aminotransferase class I/II-fold pyridoxal phosphate-dependent enzyme [Candidatus Krumholzibacteria bacterium]HPD72101.1 aminotransferase class I/II-fold pyridoxal phosphate-dependent enzyme [Candidatus Krumholzibacteria bacterium]HRY40967.1 aminotransferase class I/II-fold pyridoxal phosphate-dependent enzyme [Candidatus Krumholzibacteria bacterium]